MSENKKPSLYYGLPANPVSAGLRGKCPRCGNGPLFQGLLKLRKSCSSCELPFDFADSGDGPAVFVILILGFVIVGGVLFIEFTYQPPLWLHMVIWAPVTVLLSIALLRPLKGLLIAMQYRNNASEGKLDD
ncbi:DUF983 domain-containing protein [Pseudovibrio sp. Tun.PSC04-5.I4]|uniref:DUF983 domain-containing protein n=1 Tax=Pseudovibrio sp. Tun.PSC04-5.I4 TaxID=1798213 RepID=UPI00088ADA01|nr:DUF983 domain-containing protein [Pseudovibrio sp. Tun.PSC04-5.I4]SDQ79904.1 Uncharacterized conserved protein, DUF983 family [Pseudovibrio sp. Tun.PSC04-5.I4]